MVYMMNFLLQSTLMTATSVMLTFENLFPNSKEIGKMSKIL